MIAFQWKTNATRALNHSIYARCQSYIKVQVCNIVRTSIKKEKSSNNTKKFI